jgi:hypothetical protein
LITARLLIGSMLKHRFGRKQPVLCFGHRFRS